MVSQGTEMSLSGPDGECLDINPTSKTDGPVS